MTAEQRQEYGVHPPTILGSAFFAGYEQLPPVVQEEVKTYMHTAPEYVPPARQVSRGELTVEDIRYKDTLANDFAATLDPDYPRIRKTQIIKWRRIFRAMINPIPPEKIPFAVTEVFRYDNEKQRNTPKNR